MCKRITCDTCSKPGWMGCGEHVEDILGDVEPKDRCSCDGGATEKADGGFLKKLLS